MTRPLGPVEIEYEFVVAGAALEALLRGHAEALGFKQVRLVNRQIQL